jgi:hypothetical protein
MKYEGVHNKQWKSSVKYSNLRVITFLTMCLLPQLSLGESGESGEAEQLQITRSRSVTNVNQAAKKVVEEIKRQSPNVVIRNRADRIGPSLLLNLNLDLNGETTSEQAQDFINRFSSIWGYLSISIEKIESRNNRQIVYLVGDIEGVRLLNQQSKLSIVNGKAQHLSNGLGALQQLIKAKISIEQAKKGALTVIDNQGLQVRSINKMAVSYEPGIAYEVFEVRIIDPLRLATWLVLLDGKDGAILRISSGEKN